MCGIFGKINFQTKTAVDKNQLKSAIDAMSHRGPDDEGIFVDRYAGLGMKRLKIIDLESGHQPIFNETGNLVIVYNGEIYNYIELRDELLKKGHKFKTKSDTEVILHLFEEYGPECLEKLNGMFSFAVWDTKKEEMFIARDRLGIKPLFYSINNGTLIFSSEIKSILTDSSIKREMDEQAFTNYLSFYYVSSQWTIFKNIKRLPPAHYIKIKNGQVEIKEYWDYLFGSVKITEKQAIEEIDGTLLQSVKRHLQSDVPLGVFLSSGLDSTSIVAMMSRLSYDTKTYTIGYENGGTYNEINEAKLVARKYGTDHSDCILKPARIEEYLPRIINHLAEPHGDWTHIALYYLSKESRKDVTVVLSGAGGDELFGGYPTLTAAKIAKYYRKFPHFVKNLIKSAVYRLPSSYKRLSFDFIE